MMRKHKTKLYQWRLRLAVVWRILTGRNKHFVVLNLDEEGFRHVVAESLFADSYYLKSIDFTYVGMCELQAYYVMLYSVGTFDRNKIPLMRAEFQADVDESMLNAKSDADGKR